MKLHKSGAGPRSLRLKVLGKKRGWYDDTYDCIQSYITVIVYSHMSRERNHEYEASHKNGAGPRSLRLKVLGQKAGMV